MDYQFLPYGQLQVLIEALINSGYQCIGPQALDGAIVYDELTKASQLPWGYEAEQQPGAYSLKPTNTPKAFAWANGPEGIKPHLFKSQETVWRVERDELGQIVFKPHLADEKPIAYLGARACDIAAMKVQDKVFIDGVHSDPRYKKRREQMFIIGVNCGLASDNCFCVSAGTGPEITNTFDLLMTEITKGFVIRSGSERGQAILAQLGLAKATKKQCGFAQEETKQAADMQTKRIPLDNQRALRDLLFQNLNHVRWDEVAERCLSCGNCTSVCPTCFCHSEIEKPSLDGSASEHQREWDSCFTQGHSYLAGKAIRDDTKKRYRQWLTHKVGSWFDQFDESGCVGCGRCVTWCPVGIDITEELSAISGEPNVLEKEND